MSSTMTPPTPAPRKAFRSTDDNSLEQDLKLALEDRLLASAFHPEMTSDPRVHELFLGMV